MMPLTSPWLASAGLSCRFASRILISMGIPLTPVTSLLLAVATTLIHEGTNTWIGTQRRRGTTRVISGMRLTFKKSIQWAKWGRRRKKDPDGDVHVVVTMNAGMKYKELAERRLNAARVAFEVAAVELRAAERGMNDAEKYVKSLRSHCDKVNHKQNELNDVVLVEHAS